MVSTSVVVSYSFIDFTILKKLDGNTKHLSMHTNQTQLICTEPHEGHTPLICIPFPSYKQLQ